MRGSTTVSWRLLTPELPLRTRAEAFVTARWYGKPGVLMLLLPFEWLYCKIFARRKARALARLALSRELRLPTLVVGNLVAGGTGKTPVVIELVQQLQALGATPGVITRGYGGVSPRWPLAVTPDSDPRICGDEAVELALATGCPVVAGPDRCASVRWLLQNTDCTHVVSDDGLQHYSMARELEVVLVDAERQFGNGHRLPVGPLREPVARLNSSDIVLLTAGTLDGSNNARAEVERSLVREALCLFAGALEPVSAQPIFTPQSVPARSAPFANRDCIALTGIGSPQRFQNDLQSLGCRVEPREFADHQDYTSLVSSGALEEWMASHWVVTTAKDAVKLRTLLADRDESPCEKDYERLWVLYRRLVLSAAEHAELTEHLKAFVRSGIAYGKVALEAEK